MNPEFQRQLWLQLSATRLGVLPLLLLVCFMAVYLSAPEHPAQALAAVGAVLFVVLVWGMGTLAAGASVMQEMAERTWDQQRMSAMQPWAMTWGKLAGATAYGWYGGGLCLLVAVPCAWLGNLRPLVTQGVLGGVLSGIFMHALLVAVNLQLAKAGTTTTRNGGAWVMLVVLLWILGPAVSVLRDEDIHWWGQWWNKPDFALMSLALFAACAVCAAWRSMAEVLAVRQLPWGWPALALAASAYFSGFAPTHRLPVFALVGLSTCVVMTYFALLADPQHRPLWQRVVQRLQEQQWRGALLQLPRWPTTLLLALPFAGLTALTLSPDGDWAWMAAKQIALQPVALVLLLARDCALALFFAFSPQNRRPVLAWLTLLLVLHGLIPWLLGAAGLRLALQWVQPLLATGSLALVAALVQLVLALGLLRWRWQAPQAQAPGPTKAIAH